MKGVWEPGAYFGLTGLTSLLCSKSSTSAESGSLSRRVWVHALPKNCEIEIFWNHRGRVYFYQSFENFVKLLSVLTKYDRVSEALKPIKWLNVRDKLLFSLKNLSTGYGLYHYRALELTNLKKRCLIQKKDDRYLIHLLMRSYAKQVWQRGRILPDSIWWQRRFSEALFVHDFEECNKGNIGGTEGHMRGIVHPF